MAEHERRWLLSEDAGIGSLRALNCLELEYPRDGEDRADEDSGRIGGYAAVFYDGSPESEYQLWDNAVERIMPGAFDRALEEGQDVAALFNHDPNNLLGRSSSETLSLRVFSRGLRYSITPSSTRLYGDVREMVRRGDLAGSSFGFQIRQEEWIRGEDRDIRLIKDVDLFDVGPVTFPAYKSSSVSVRASLRLPADRGAWERAEREIRILELDTSAAPR